MMPNIRTLSGNFRGLSQLVHVRRRLRLCITNDRIVLISQQCLEVASLVCTASIESISKFSTMSSYCKISGVFIVIQALLLARTNAVAVPSLLSHSDQLMKPNNWTTTSYNSSNTRMPGGAWDFHHHVMDPIRFPSQPNAQYTPGLYTVWDNAMFEYRLGCEHVVMIQPSFYGNDNTFMIDSLKAYGPDRALAVVVFDASNITAQ